MNGEIAVMAFEGIGTAPASSHLVLEGGPLLDILSLGGLTVALIAAAVLLLLNRDDSPRAAAH